MLFHQCNVVKHGAITIGQFYDQVSSEDFQLSSLQIASAMLEEGGSIRGRLQDAGVDPDSPLTVIHTVPATVS